MKNLRDNTYIIGITGGIGSGKSVVSRLLRLMDVPVYDCDREAKRLMHESHTIREALTEAIGTGVYGTDGHLDRTFLASYMFGNATRVAMVNGIVHPVVRTDFKQWARQTGKPLVAVESAILFEAGMDADVDTVWLVHAPESVRLQRAVQRDRASKEAVMNRMRSQLKEEEYIQRANCIICNDGTSSLIAQVGDLLHGIYRK